MTDKRSQLLEMAVHPVYNGRIEERRAAAAELLDSLLQEARVEQARADAELMQLQSDRAPDTKPPVNGTNSRTVFAAAAEQLHPDRLGWSLQRPDHLKGENA